MDIKQTKFQSPVFWGEVLVSFIPTITVISKLDWSPEKLVGSIITALAIVLTQIAAVYAAGNNPEVKNRY